jgi:1-acyl-sn-glycerol-3-phosphate acyltransferase
MMAKDMMLPRFAPLWSWVGVIGVSRVGGDSSAARQALRHLAAGGVLGMFPEGGIARPRRQVLPFEPGVGLIIGKSRAPVLQAVIDGTPYTHSAWGSLLRPSKTRIEFLPLMPYDAGGLKPAEIALDLRSRLLQATGWPENLEPRKDVIRR